MCFTDACDVKQNNQGFAPIAEQYLSVSFPISTFDLQAEITISASIGFSEDFIALGNNRKQALLVISKNEEIDFNNENVSVLKTITDFSHYTWIEQNDIITYNFSKAYVVPNNYFTETYGKFYCGLYIFPLDIEYYSQNDLIYCIQYPILYEKNSECIELRLITEN